MKTIFDKETRNEVIGRINSLNQNNAAQWGKMNVYQMIKHCILWEDMILRKKKYKQAFIGKIFGKMALRKVLKDDSPLGRNTPTLPEFKISGDGDVLPEKAKWIALIQEYDNFSNDDFVHPFFGKMTRAQIGQMAYKHADHHLRQFKS